MSPTSLCQLRSCHRFGVEIEITELRFSHDECTHLVDARAVGQIYIEAFPARASIDGAKDVTFPS